MRSVLRRIFAAVLCVMLLSQTAFAYSTLEKGDSGSDVKKMQQALTKLGYTVEADGKYGTETVNTVKLFQKDYGLSVRVPASMFRVLAVLAGISQSSTMGISSWVSPRIFSIN